MHIKRYKQQKMNFEKLLANKFSKTTIAIRFALLKFSSALSFIFAVLFILFGGIVSTV